MKLSYRPTFEQFSDNYLATYYSGGVSTLRRIAGGPVFMLAGVLLIVFVFDRVDSWLLRAPTVLIGLAIFFYGLSYAAGPLFNVFLVSLRKEQLFGNEKSLTTLELLADDLHVDENGEQVKLPLSKIKSVQHRKESTWILTHGDTLIYIPREGLISGEHDKFVQALEEKIAPKEEPE